MTGPELPSPVRSVLVKWAADTLGHLPAAQIPAGLTKVARFTPAKRAKLAAAALSQAVDSDAGFRAAVADRVRNETDQDPVHAAALAHLLGLPTEDGLLSAVRDALPGPADESAGLRQTIRDLRRDLKQVTAERDEARRHQETAVVSTDDQLDRLRGRLREQGTRLGARKRRCEPPISKVRTRWPAFGWTCSGSLPR